MRNAAQDISTARSGGRRTVRTEGSVQRRRGDRVVGRRRYRDECVTQEIGINYAPLQVHSIWGVRVY